MTNRQEVSEGGGFGHQLEKNKGEPIHTLPGNLLASTLAELSQGGWTGLHAAKLRKLNKTELLALCHLLENKVALRTALEGYMGANFFAPANKRVIHVGPVAVEVDINKWPVQRQGISLELFSSKLSFQLKNLELISIDSETQEKLFVAIEPIKLQYALVPYSAMQALWNDMMEHEVDHSSVLVELVKRTNKPVKRIFCGQRVSAGMATGYLCIEDLICEIRKSESSGTMEGDFLLTWKS